MDCKHESKHIQGSSPVSGTEERLFLYECIKCGHRWSEQKPCDHDESEVVGCTGPDEERAAVFSNRCLTCGHEWDERHSVVVGSPTVSMPHRVDDIPEHERLRDHRYPKGVKGEQLERAYYRDVEDRRKSARKTDGVKAHYRIPAEAYAAMRKRDGFYWNESKNRERWKDWRVQ